MQANVIKGGTLTLGGVKNGDGVCHVYDAEGNLVIQMDNCLLYTSYYGTW